jgi:proteic killer suppression protein
VAIQRITHKGLRLFWEKDDPSKLPAEQIAKIGRILDALDSLSSLDPLQAIPGYHLHRLKGDKSEFWAVRVTGNYRIIFRFVQPDIYDVDYLDYH